jgi:hypothetical protein
MRTVLIIVLFMNFAGQLNAQSKKEIIEQLNSTIDSCELLLISNKATIDSLNILISEKNKSLKSMQQNSLEKDEQLSKLNKEQSALSDKNRILKKTIDEDQKYFSISGFYGYDAPTSSGSLILSYRGNKTFTFDLSVGSEDCTGLISGSGTIDDKGIGRYSMDDCGELIFNFLNSSVLISELSCDEYHGENCGFHGQYNETGLE